MLSDLELERTLALTLVTHTRYQIVQGFAALAQQQPAQIFYKPIQLRNLQGTSMLAHNLLCGNVLIGDSGQQFRGARERIKRGGRWTDQTSGVRFGSGGGLHRGLGHVNRSGGFAGQNDRRSKRPDSHADCQKCYQRRDQDHRAAQWQSFGSKARAEAVLSSECKLLG